MAFLVFFFFFIKDTFVTLLVMYYHHTDIYRYLLISPVTVEDNLNLLIGHSYQSLDNTMLHRRSWNSGKMPQINYSLKGVT